MKAVLVAVFAVLLVAAVAQEDDMDVTAEDLTDCKAAAKLIPELNPKGSFKPDGYTLLCPTNDAFLDLAEALGYEEVNSMLSDKVDAALLKSIMANHIIKGVIPTDKIKDGQTLTTLSRGGGFVVEMDDGDINLVNDLVSPEDGEIVPENTDSLDGPDLTFEGPYTAKSVYVIHGVGRVLIPKSLASALMQLADSKE